MATVPTLPVFPAGAVVTSAQLTSLSTALAFAINTRPIASMWQNVTQNIAQGVWTNITFGTTVVDTDGGHTETDTSVYRCKTDGWYFTAARLWVAGGYPGSPDRYVRLTVNGTVVPGSAAELVATAPGPNGGVTSKEVFLRAGDALQVQGWQNSTQASPGIATYSDTSGLASSLDLHWLRAA